MSVKLLILSEATLADVAGGVQKSLATELTEFRDRGYDIQLLVRQHRADSPLEEELDEIRITRLPSPLRGSLGFYLHPFNTMRRGPAAIEQLYVRWPFDVAVAHSTFWANALARSNTPARKVFCFHAPAGDEISIDISQRKYGALTGIAKLAVGKIIRAESDAIGRMDSTFARSSFMRDRLRQIHPEHGNTDIPVIPLMVDTAQFPFAEDGAAARTELNLPPDRPIALCVRRLVARMGFDQLIGAISILRQTHPDVLLLIGGRGYLDAELRQLVSEQKLDENIRFLGFVPDEELARYYAACDLFVLPTAELEGFGLVTLEAASTGRLVVATPVGGSVEVVSSFDPALLTAGKDAPALASGLGTWLPVAREPERRRQMRARCEELYSRNAVADRLEKVIQSPMANSAGVEHLGTEHETVNRTESSLPTVSVVIPMRNEKHYIGSCLDGLLAGTYPPELLEFLVIDGNSTDESPDIVRGYAAKDNRVRLLPNPNQTSASAINIGLHEATGEIVVRIDAHAEYAPDYVAESVAALILMPEAGGAAGLQRATGKSYWQSAIALAMGGPFGSGFAKYRGTEQACWVDTIYLGAWRREVALAIGGFDTGWKINEDYEFNIRMRKAGFGLFLSPAIRSSYYPRANILALAKQYFRYGIWRVRTVYAHPRDVKWRQFAAPAFIVLLLAFAAFSPISPWPLITISGLYVLAAVAASIQTGAKSSWAYVPSLPFVFAAMHLSWGAGFLAGLVRWLPQAADLRRRKSHAAVSVVLDVPKRSGAS